MAHGTTRSEIRITNNPHEFQQLPTIVPGGGERALAEHQEGNLMAGTSGTTIRKVWQTLSAIKTGVILLIITVIVSAAGTLILQRPATDADELQRAYSPHMLRLLDAMGLTDFFPDLIRARTKPSEKRAQCRHG
jgi:hypothetical protein